MRTAHPVSHIDKLYRCLIGGGMFPAGWGDAGRVKALLEFHKVMSNRNKVQSLIDPYPQVFMEKSGDSKKYQLFNGYIHSPFAKNCPGLLPEGSEICRFQFIVPTQFQMEARPVAIHMAGTGDQHFWRRRRLLAEPLATENGIASLLMENPFYGSRRPPNQIRSNVRFVSDIFVMGGGLMLESLALLRWLEWQGFGPFCMTGISMGGHMACLGATNYPKPIAIAPCLSWTTASSVFTRGVMTNAINWDTCERTYLNEPVFRKEIFDNLIHYQLETSDTDIDATVGDQKVTKSKVLQWGTSPYTLTKWLRVLLEFPKSLQAHFKLTFPPFPPMSSFFNLSNANGRTTAGTTNSKPTPHKLHNFYNQGDSVTRRESLEFMKRLMDHFTHLSNFEQPVDPELATIITARYDAYVLRDGVKPIEEIWPGCTVRHIEAGHVISYVRYQNEFRNAIRDSLKKHCAKYNQDGTSKYKST